MKYNIKDNIAPRLTVTVLLHYINTIFTVIVLYKYNVNTRIHRNTEKCVLVFKKFEIRVIRQSMYVKCYLAVSTILMAWGKKLL